MELTEPDTLLTVTGLAIIVVTVGLLIWGKVSPVVAMVLVPLAGAAAIGFGFEDLTAFFSSGLSSVMNVVVMFIFAIIFFGILSDAGLFDPLIRRLILMTRGRVILVAVGTVLIGAIAHLDGAGATTFLICIPALLPLYKALNMSRYLLLLLVCLSASIMNMVPWGGPMGRVAAVLGEDPAAIYRPLIAVQGVGLVLLILLAVALGIRETRRIEAGVAAGRLQPVGGVDVKVIAQDFVDRQREARVDVEKKINRHPVIFWANVALVVLVLTVMLSGWMPPALTFLLATAIALPLNFNSATTQMDQLKLYAPNALMMAAVILAAAVFLGVLNESGMLASIALSLIAVMPEAVGGYLHIIVGVLGVPLDILTSTDAYYFAVLPLVVETAGAFGVDPMSTAYALMVGNIIGTFVSPFSPAMWLALGLADANIGRHLKYSFGIMWAFSIVLLGACVLMGLISI